MKANGDIVIAGSYHRAGIHLLERFLGFWHLSRSIGRNRSPRWSIMVKANGDIVIVGEISPTGCTPTRTVPGILALPFHREKQSLGGVAVKANGDIVIVGQTTDL